ncbi:uncharacterized protein LOC142331790 [Lycorma delicatula]|uniref:uncharacterized protein LOC142331790 n=1 Tax=Lycorma delicatula TaxID=130591 RepID=UPI003F50FF04
MLKSNRHSEMLKERKSDNIKHVYFNFKTYNDNYYYCCRDKITLVFTILSLLISGQTVSSEPILPSTGAGATGTWSMRPITHQTNSMLPTTVYEQIQNLKYSWESVIDQMTRKIEMLESKIARMDTANQLRLEKLTEAVNSREIKEELSTEQLSRKLDFSYEKINHKLNYMETRLDATLNKMQNTLDSGIGRIESRQTELDNGLTEISQSVEEIKSLTIQMEDKHNSTQKSVQQHLQTIMSESISREQLEKLRGTVQNIDSKLNDNNYSIIANHRSVITNQNQNDASGQSSTDVEKIIQALKTEVDRESHRVENKISNMYNELWRRIMSLEVAARSVIVLGNTTRRQLQDDLKTFLQTEKQCLNEPNSQESYIEVLMEALANSVQELTRKVDTNFQMVLTTQSLFMENCHRLQVEETQLEFKLSLVLEKILITITNKTMRVDNRLVEVMEMIKSHQSQVMRNLGHTTNMVVALTEETNQDTKHFETALLELSERNEIVALSIQELQENIQMLTNLTSIKLNNEIEDWFNKSLDTDYEENSNQHNNKNTEKSTTVLLSPTSTTTATVTQAQNNDKITSKNNFNNTKSTDSDVIKIYTDDVNSNNNNENIINLNDINNKNDMENISKAKKISIIFSNRNYDGENMKMLLKDLLNQGNQSLNVDAIILNTESEENEGNNTTLLDTQDEPLKTEQFHSKLQNDSLTDIHKNKMDMSDTVKLNLKNTTTMIDELKINETSKILNNNTKTPSLTQVIKNRLDTYKTQKYKIYNSYNNNTSSISNNTNNDSKHSIKPKLLSQSGENNSLKKLLENFKRRKLFNLSPKFSNTLSTQLSPAASSSSSQSEDIFTISDKNDTSTSDFLKQSQFSFEKISEEDPSSKISQSTSKINNNDMTNPDEKLPNLYDFNSKYFNMDTSVSSNIHEMETKDQLTDYDEK